MTTDDAPRSALDAGEIAEGRRLLAAASDGPWMVREDMDGDDDHTWYFPVGIAQEDPSFPGVAGDAVIQYAEFGTDHHQAMDDARIIIWLRNHADALLAAATERDALAREAVRYRGALGRIRDFDADSVQSPIGPLHAIGMQQAYKDVAEFARSSLTPSSGRG